MTRPTLLAIAAAMACGVSIAAAQTQARTDVEVAKAKPSAKVTTTSRQQLDSQAKGLALATETVQTINQNQLDIAARVLTGRAECEFDQAVDVQPIAGKPGFFKVGYRNASYTMIPEETSTGAVRLEDKKAGVMWLQIPAKSMLMNSKIGQRMVDACTHSEQRAAVAAAKAAAR